MGLYEEMNELGNKPVAEHPDVSAIEFIPNMCNALHGHDGSAWCLHAIPAPESALRLLPALPYSPLR